MEFKDLEFIQIKTIVLKFIYSENAAKFCKFSTLILSTVHADKSKVKILQNFVAFSEYMNFTGAIKVLVFWEDHKFCNVRTNRKIAPTFLVYRIDSLNKCLDGQESIRMSKKYCKNFLYHLFLVSHCFVIMNGKLFMCRL